MTWPSDPHQPPPPPGSGAPPPGPGPWGPGPGWGPPPDRWAGPPFHPDGTPRPQSGEDVTLAVVAHLSVFFAGVVAPLVIYLIKRDQSPYVRSQAAEALNFHLTTAVASIGLLVLFVLLAVASPVAFLGLLAVFPLLFVGAAVFGVLGAVAAGRGEAYRYPLNLRMVR